MKLIQLAAAIMALPIIATASVAAFQVSQSNLELPQPIQLVKSSAKSISGLRSHLIQKDEEGRIYGRIVGFSDREMYGIGDIKFDIVQAGKIIASGVTDAEGQFSVGNLSPGGYGIQAETPSAALAVGFTVAPYSPESESHLFEVAAITQNPLQLLSRISAQAKTTPSEHDQSLGVVASNRIQLVDGTLKGIVHSIYRDLPVAQTQVELRQNGSLVAEASVANDGSFQFKNLTEGVYDFLALGPMDMRL